MGQLGGTTFGTGTPATYPITPLATQRYLQIVAQQLQQAQLLQQQLVQLQQLLQFLSAQLQQLQQLIQILPQQVPNLQQPSPPFNPTLSGSLGFGLVPQGFGQLTSHVM